MKLYRPKLPKLSLQEGSGRSEIRTVESHSILKYIILAFFFFFAVEKLIFGELLTLILVDDYSNGRTSSRFN